MSPRVSPIVQGCKVQGASPGSHGRDHEATCEMVVALMSRRSGRCGMNLGLLVHILGPTCVVGVGYVSTRGRGFNRT